MTTRKQLTLFLNKQESKDIEQIRKKYNPAQYQLIKSHITLCREDELENLDLVLENLREIKSLHIEIDFLPPVRFDEGKGVFLPAKMPCEIFSSLRKQILHNIIENPRESHPHITLIHPRNGICTDEIFEEIFSQIFFQEKKRNNQSNIFSFQKIYLIEQKNGKKWNILDVFGK